MPKPETSIMEKGGEKNDSSNLQKENMIMESIKIEIKADLLLQLEIMIVGNSESQEEEDKKNKLLKWYKIQILTLKRPAKNKFKISTFR